VAGLSLSDRELVKKYCEDNQRGNKVAIRKLMEDWRKGIVTTSAPLDVATGYPRGWSERNLLRFAPSKYELKAARIGRSAAANDRQLVYTTRANLWVGSHYLFDDIWHDHFVNNLDQRKAGRPLEFHALDLYSADKFAWGMRVRTEQEGVMTGLKGEDMRFLLAYVLGNFGYSPRGTKLVVEHGTAAISKEIEDLVTAASGGLITIERSGMEGAAAAAHQYAGRAKGNFRFKAALESLGNLIHNEMAALPGQTGMDIDHRPEQLHGLLKHNDALLAAMSQLTPERIEMLQWPLLTIQQFLVIAGEIYERINARTQHRLEGWDQNYVPDRRTGLMRRMAPVEVFNRGRRDLITLPPDVVALIIGLDMAEERSVRRGMIELTSAEISGDVLRFQALDLKDGEKYRTVLNPSRPDALMAFDAKGRFVAACPRILSADRSDAEAVQRACGKAAKVEAALLAPLRARHLAEARQKMAMHKNNAEVVGGTTPAEKARERDLRAFSANTTDFLDSPVTTPEPALTEPAGFGEDFGADGLL
jgi:hypothetical protein